MELSSIANGRLFYPTEDTVSEWLRRWTRNPLGSARRGSNPLGVDFLDVKLQFSGISLLQILGQAFGREMCGI